MSADTQHRPHVPVSAPSSRSQGEGRGESGTFASGAPGAAVLAGGLALAAALLLAPGAAQAQTNANCGALANGVANCPNAAYANGISYWNQMSGVTLTVPGTATTATITASTTAWNGLDNGISIRTSAHATETRNIALTVGSTGAVAIVQGSSPEANAWYRNHGILVSPLAANGSTVTVDVKSGVTIGTATTRMSNTGIEVVDVPGAVSVTSAARIYAGVRGIRIGNAAGTTMLTNSGAITAGGDGIYVRSWSSAGAITVTNSGAIASAAHGIYVSDEGSAGATTVTNSGAITTDGGDGIFARTAGQDAAGANAGVSIAHSAGAIRSADRRGIKAHVGTSRQEADTMHADYVAPENEGLARVAVTGGSVRSKWDAIEAINFEAGSVEVRVSSGVTLTSTDGHGIRALLADVGNTSGTIIVTNAGTIAAGTTMMTARDGITVSRTAGSGAVAVENSGAIEASGHGISAVAGGAGGTVSVTNRGGIEAGGDGIHAVAWGAGGAVSVTNSGPIGKADEKVSRGMFVSHAGAGASGDVTVRNSGAITAEEGGILAQTINKDAEGANAGVTVTHSAGAIATEDLEGIRAYVGEPRQESDADHDDYVAPKNAGLAKVEVTGGSVRSKWEAIEAINFEAGSVEVRVSEEVTLTSTHGHGVWVRLADAGNASGTITVTNAGTISAAGADRHGIVANRDAGSGAVSITNSGTVTAGGDGIFAVAMGVDGAMTITNRGAIGKADAQVFRGIFVAHDGTGATGSVTVTNSGSIAAKDYGIFAVDRGAGGAMTIANSGAITAGRDGIFARTTGKDAEGANAGVTVTHSAGAIASADGRGIKVHVGEARQETDTGHDDYVAPRNKGLLKVEVTGGSIRSKWEPIEAYNHEAGSVEVRVASGVTLTSTHGHGIWGGLTDAGNASGTITIDNAGTIRVPKSGITFALGGGSGDVTVTNSGALEVRGDGIFAVARAAVTGDISITNRGAIGKADAQVFRGIFVAHDGTGATGSVTVTNSGAITAVRDGIFARTTGKDAEGANAGVTVTHSAGAIASADGRGIKVHVGEARQETDTGHDDYVAPRNRGLLKVEVTGGSIDSKWEPIEAYNHEAGSVEVRVASGVTLTSTHGHGIWGGLTDAGNASGTITVTNAGTIRAPKSGITFALGGGSGDVTVTNRGALEVEGDGIFAVARAAVTGDISITNRGAIGKADARVRHGIFASHDGTGATGAVTVANSGDVMATKRGILAQTKFLDAEGANDGVTVTHSAGTIDVTDDGRVDSDKQGIVARVGNWRQERDSSHADYVAPKNTGAVKINVTGGTIAAKGSAVEGANYEAGGVEINVARGVTLSSTHEHAIEADLRDVGNAGGTIAVTQAGTISASGDGISAKVTRRDAATADRVIDIVWTGTFTALEEKRGSPPNVARAVEAAQGRQAVEELGDLLRFARGSAGIDAGVMKWQTFMRPVSEGDDPGAFADKAAQDALFAADADAATKARAAAIVARFKSVLENEAPGTIPGADAIDADNNGSYSDTEIEEYLSEDDDARRTLLRNVLTQSFTEHEKAVFEAVLTDGDVEAALAAAPAGYGDAWKTGVRALRAHHNTGDIRIAMNGGSITSSGDGIRAFFGRTHDDNGAIRIDVAEGASVTGGMAGIYAENAGHGLRIEKKYTLPAVQEENEDKGPDDLVTFPKHHNQVVKVDGTVTGGTDAAVHLAGGGALIVGETGKLVAGSSGRAVLVNHPGPAAVYIDGEATGGESPTDSPAPAAAVHLTGGGSVTVGLNGSVKANGADSAIRGDNEPTVIYIDGEATGDEGATAAVHLTGGGSVTVGLNGSVKANGADSAIRGDNEPTEVVVLIDSSVGDLTQGSAREILLARVQGGIVGDGIEEVTIAEVRDGVTTGHMKEDLPVDGDGNVIFDELPPDAFRCDKAVDRRCRLYEALPSVLLVMNDLPSYAERTSAARDGNGGWARVEAAFGKWQAARATSPGKLAYDHRRTVGRAGFDLIAGESGRIGGSLHVLGGKAEMSGVGEATLNGAGAGISATWLPDLPVPGDLYVDAQAGMTRYDVALDSTRHGRLVKDADATGYAVGVEAGNRMALGEGLMVTPRAGLAWSKVDLKGFMDMVGSRAQVSMKDARSTKGRLGVTMERAAGPEESPGRVFGSLDVEHEFSDETEVVVSGNKLGTKLRKTAVRVGLGGVFSLGEDVSLRASANYTTSGGNTNEYGGRVELNLRL